MAPARAPAAARSQDGRGRAGKVAPERTARPGTPPRTFPSASSSIFPLRKMAGRGKGEKNPFREGGREGGRLARGARAVPTPGCAPRPRRRPRARDAGGRERARAEGGGEGARPAAATPGGPRALLHRGRAQRRRRRQPGRPAPRTRRRPARGARGRAPRPARPAAARAARRPSSARKQKKGVLGLGGSGGRPLPARAAGSSLARRPRQHNRRAGAEQGSCAAPRRLAGVVVRGRARAGAAQGRPRRADYKSRPRRRRAPPRAPPPAARPADPAASGPGPGGARGRGAAPGGDAGDVRLWANFLVALGGVEKAGARPAPARPETPEPEEAALEPRPRSVGAARTCPAPVFVNKPRA
ncbi:skin secretory protein xP2-like [Equus przewalskii]|uniref:Skin secretory protein xP2-like n=1 Tax=Equus przewalskii TaxID=9798 RepID=A0ABM4MGT9_EQUPR